MDGPVRSVFSEIQRRTKLFGRMDRSGWKDWRDEKKLAPGWREIFKHVKFEESMAGHAQSDMRVGDLIW